MEIMKCKVLQSLHRHRDFSVFNVPFYFLKCILPERRKFEFNNVFGVYIIFPGVDVEISQIFFNYITRYTRTRFSF